MQLLRQKILVLCFSVTMILTGCQNSVVSSSWRDESFRGDAVRKVFIIGSLNSDLLRRKVEDAFARQLKARGVETLQSYLFFENEKTTDKAQVTARIRQEGCSNVLVTKLLDQKSRAIDNTASCMSVDEWKQSGWHPFFIDVCQQQPYWIEVGILKIESALYDAQTEKLLWATLTHTELATDPTDRDINEWVKLVLETMLGRR